MIINGRFQGGCCSILRAATASVRLVILNAACSVEIPTQQFSPSNTVYMEAELEWIGIRSFILWTDLSPRLNRSNAELGNIVEKM